ncbi:hypothetical protein GW17_00052372 [Ensete ventricosum]|nr:hypothetical protein GW17_00052372 [Ensete ventricosum]
MEWEPVRMCSDSEFGCWSGGVRVKREYSSSGRPPTPARRSGRVGSRRDPSEDQVSSCIGLFSLSLSRRGAGAFIVGTVDHSYLVGGADFSCVRSAVRPLAPPVYPAGYLRRVDHVGGPAVRGYDDLAAVRGCDDLAASHGASDAVALAEVGRASRAKGSPGRGIGE